MGNKLYDMYERKDRLCNGPLFKEELELIGYSMLGYLQDLSALADNSNMVSVLPLLLELQYNKELDYGNSWKLRGEYRGIIPNIDRKYDRLNIMIQREIDDPSFRLPEGDIPTGISIEEWDDKIGESKIDAVADLANYCLMYFAYLKDKHPGAFNTWIRKNFK